MELSEKIEVVRSGSRPVLILVDGERFPWTFNEVSCGSITRDDMPTLTITIPAKIVIVTDSMSGKKEEE